MTTHGDGGVRRWLLGSVAEKLVRQAAAPVLLVRARPSQVATPTAVVGRDQPRPTTAPEDGPTRVSWKHAAGHWRRLAGVVTVLSCAGSRPLRGRNGVTGILENNAGGKPPLAPTVGRTKAPKVVNDPHADRAVRSGYPVPVPGNAAASGWRKEWRP